MLTILYQYAKTDQSRSKLFSVCFHQLMTRCVIISRNDKNKKSLNYADFLYKFCRFLNDWYTISRYILEKTTSKA